MALWFHDAVYRTFRKDNELQSAVCANDFLLANGAKIECAERVRALVMATAHLDAAEVGGDAALIVDIDLSILGSSAAAYDEFEENVRKGILVGAGAALCDCADEYLAGVSGAAGHLQHDSVS